MKIGIFYGTNTGNTEKISKIIAKKLNINNIFDISKNKINLINNYDIIFIGSSTWFYGELQYDWECRINELKKINFYNKYICLFGCGDQVNYSDNFCDGLYYIYKSIYKNDIRLLGLFDKINYNFNKSKSFIKKKNKFLGLVIDEDNQKNETEERINKWLIEIDKKIKIFK
ncbi:flavodoxin [Candidatus Nardonella dryophthoridicola]|uniref:Flavodoxin n=1 Tax=endosymbiont of Rhynchophorus ferrugineus TaxID=1972133 RepID=A0A2Z5T3P9_9GAMM|nr:flavodoxin [Candidatus Nardonella dryophthoridicola]QTJ62967.1 flavodoxin [Candidatus Nardonella dryophthoridicola]BBA85018.1 flavodoxin [endosymbiont of Rhynchophorus ferrugineus]